MTERPVNNKARSAKPPADNEASSNLLVRAIAKSMALVRDNGVALVANLIVLAFGTFAVVLTATYFLGDRNYFLARASHAVIHLLQNELSTNGERSIFREIILRQVVQDIADPQGAISPELSRIFKDEIQKRIGSVVSGSATLSDNSPGHIAALFAPSDYDAYIQVALEGLLPGELVNVTSNTGQTIPIRSSGSTDLINLHKITSATENPATEVLTMNASGALRHLKTLNFQLTRDPSFSPNINSPTLQRSLSSIVVVRYIVVTAPLFEGATIESKLR